MEKEYWIFKIESKHREIDSNVLLIFQEIEREREREGLGFWNKKEVEENRGRAVAYLKRIFES